jgi:hypothetical protein
MRVTKDMVSEDLSGQPVPAEDLPDLSGKEVPAHDLPEHSLSGKPVPLEDMPSVSGTPVPQHDLPEEALQEKYATPMQQAATVAEGLFQGATMGGSTYLEQKLGVPTEDILARKKANPAEALYSDIGGNIGMTMALPAVGGAANLGTMAKVGAGALKGFLSTMAFQGGDEFSNYLLGEGNPLPVAAAHIAEMGAIGLLTGAAAKGANSVVSKIADTKIGTNLKSFLVGLGHAAHFPGEKVVSLSESALSKEEARGLNNVAFKTAQHLYKHKIATASALVGGHVTGLTGAGQSAMIGQLVDSVLGKHIDEASAKVIGPMLMKAATSGSVDNVSQILNKATSIIKGNKLIERGIEGIFSSVPQKAFGYEESSSQEKEKTKKFTEEEGPQKIMKDAAEPEESEPYAKGGEVAPKQINEFDKHWPEQATLMSAAKMRVANYLNSQRPLKKTGGLVYDRDIPNPHHERAYDKTVGLANKPLSILKHVKDGTLVPKQVEDLNAMYPELYDHLKKKVTERISHGQLKKEKKPNYKTRQSLSLFLGANLDSSMIPQNIMAAQAVFANQQAQQNVAKLNSLNKMGKNNQTAEQSRQQRLTK